ncbi:MAG: HlyD family type I secretion periplasmic adaptor subunit [Betaproteobacteria bacterium]|nr:MAG: HlyD family type I secretion periplasmic adaptor subunit [Betaproteobacteria bacterium]
MNLDRRASTPDTAAPAPTASDDRRLRWLGLAIVLAVFGGFGTWAVLAPLSSAAHAPGVIAVESYRKTVQHLEGGIVKTIAVRDGKSVKKDDVLITLEETQPRAQLEVLRGQYFIALAREARLVAQRDGLAQVSYPNELIANQGDTRVLEAMRVQTQTFRVRKTAHEGEMSLYQQQIGQLQAKAEGLRAQRASRERLVSSYRAELDDFQALLEEGYAEKQKVREFERNLANTEGQLGEFNSNLAAVDLQVNETKLKILQLQKDLQREVAKELSEVQSQLFELREKMQSVQDTVTRTVVRAPQAGTVLDLQVHTLGAVIRPGAKLLDIVPQGERLIVEAKVSPIDIDRVHVGQRAEIRFSAFKMRDTPRVEGTLVALSADRLVDEADQHKLPYYLARVEITAKGLEDLSRQKLDLVAGMPAEVLINTGERTLFHYLVDPIKNTVARSFIED